MFKIIVAVDSNWAMGVNNKLLFSIKEDLKYFRELTENNVVIMGRKTFSSLGNKPLPNRTNIVLTRNENFKTKYEDVIICHNIQELMTTLVDPYSGYCYFPNKDIFVIGSAEIIRELFPFCTEVYITYIDYPYPDPDTFFPIRIDNLDDWKLLSEIRGKNCDNCGVDYFFRKYKKSISDIFTFKSAINPVQESVKFLAKMFQEELFGNKDSELET